MKHYDVAAFIWPSYTGKEPRSRIFWEEGIGEWQTVQKAKPKYEGHPWPVKPLWGYLDEAEKATMELQIEEASSHGVNVFIYDYYWYDNRPFLEQCLDEGFLKAENNHKMKFYLMWANHDATYLWDRRNSDVKGIENTVVWQGKVSSQSFEEFARHTIQSYFVKENYYRIDGEPVFMIYDLPNLVQSFGTLDKTKEALRWFRDQAIFAGLPGIHFQIVQKWDNEGPFPKENGELIKGCMDCSSYLGFSSYTYYQYVHFIPNLKRTYVELLPELEHAFAKTQLLPLYPHVSCGWDNNLRFEHQLWDNVIKDNTPEAFEKALRIAKAYIDAHPEQAPLITINAWNEWTEGSYLEPDDKFGYGYLDAIKRVFQEE